MCSPLPHPRLLPCPQLPKVQFFLTLGAKIPFSLLRVPSLRSSEMKVRTEGEDGRGYKKVGSDDLEWGTQSPFFPNRPQATRQGPDPRNKGNLQDKKSDHKGMSKMPRFPPRSEAGLRCVPRE